MKLSIIVPVFNEKSNLISLVDELLQSTCPLACEWIFVDDASTDGGYELLIQKSRQYDFKLIRHETQQGKGQALITGVQKATGDLILFQDADFEYDFKDVPSLLAPLIAGRADVVYGSRFKHNAPHVHRTYHFFINRLLTELSNLFSGIYLTDMETCYKVFRSDLLKSMQLRSQRFGIEVELTAYVAKTRARIFELPISYYPRTRLQGKKINWRDGVAALFHLVRFNFLVDFKQAFKDLPSRYNPTHQASLDQQNRRAS